MTAAIPMVPTTIDLERTTMQVMRSRFRRDPLPVESALGLWVDRIGRHADATTWFPAFRVLGLHALCAVSAGAGALRRPDGGEVPLRQGDAWWIPPDAPVNYGADPGTRWEHRVIVFAGPLADTLAGSGLRPAGLVAPGAGGVVLDAWQRLVPLMGLPGPAAAAARLAAVAAACSRFAGDQEAGAGHLARAVALLAAHGPGPLDVAALARRVGVSPTHLRRLFARRYAMSPVAWLMRQRLEHARQLLGSTTLPVAAIAAETGFTDPFWFTRLFRREHGCSPLAWRGRSPRKGG